MENSVFFNKGFAVTVTAAVCVLSVLFGGARALNSERNNVLKIFENGENNIGFSVAVDAEKKAQSAYDMAILAQKYNIGGADELKAAANGSLSASSAEETLSATRELDKSESSVYNGTDGKAAAFMNAQDARIWEGAHSEILSRQNTISRDPYFSRAAEYNRRLEGFPASLIRLARLAKTLPT